MMKTMMIMMITLVINHHNLQMIITLLLHQMLIVITTIYTTTIIHQISKKNLSKKNPYPNRPPFSTTTNIQSMIPTMIKIIPIPSTILTKAVLILTIRISMMNIIQKMTYMTIITMFLIKMKMFMMILIIFLTEDIFLMALTETTTITMAIKAITKLIVDFVKSRFSSQF